MTDLARGDLHDGAIVLLKRKVPVRATKPVAQCRPVGYKNRVPPELRLS